MQRPSKDNYYLKIAESVARRSTCLKRHYGCVIVQNDEIVSTGYNGAARGEANCCDTYTECPRIHVPHNSGDYSGCPAVHAEMNAMISASRQEMIGATLYLAGYDAGNAVPLAETEPCPICARMIKNAGIARIVGPQNIERNNNESPV